MFSHAPTLLPCSPLEAWDREKFTMLYSVGDQGGYLVSMVNCGWSIWAASSKALRVYTADGAYSYRKEKIKRLEQDVKDAAAREEGLQGQLREAQRKALEMQAQVRGWVWHGMSGDGMGDAGAGEGWMG